MMTPERLAKLCRNVMTHDIRAILVSQFTFDSKRNKKVFCENRLSALNRNKIACMRFGLNGKEEKQQRRFLLLLIKILEGILV